jgi:hypothetical protein
MCQVRFQVLTDDGMATFANVVMLADAFAKFDVSLVLVHSAVFATSTDALHA